ncbi:hypothetical protein EJ02DRAFT_360099, partial [Clathrospora elynae]
YIPSFFTSLFALLQICTMGIEFDSGWDCLYQKLLKNVVCKLSAKGGYWLMDLDNNKQPRVEDLWPASVAESASAAESVNTAEKRRMQGHPSDKVISKLEQGVDGVKVKEGTEAPTWQNCITCIETKLHKFKSQRPLQEPVTQSFERLAINLVQLRKTGKRCYNSDIWLFHAVCQHCKLHLAACLPNKSAPMLLATVERLLAQIETQYGVKVCAV